MKTNFYVNVHLFTNTKTWKLKFILFGRSLTSCFIILQKNKSRRSVITIFADMFQMVILQSKKQLDNFFSYFFRKIQYLCGCVQFDIIWASM